MTPLAELFFSPEQDFYHASALYAGADALARAGVIRLQLRLAESRSEGLTADPLTICIRIRGAGRPKPMLFAIDLHDQSDIFALESLERCDLYMKRSFYRPDLAGLPAGLACKVQPFGLNYACRTWGSTARLFRASALRLLAKGPAGVRRMRHHLTLPMVDEFEQVRTDQLEPTVVFQTRVWEPHESSPGECDAVNETRVGVIRALREAFGERFRGGLVPTPLARTRYRREISAYPSRRRLHTAMSRRNLIGIYTAGLHGSTAFKLAEYLAAAQCIVAEPPRHELPVPLVPGIHYLPFSSADECVAACRRLLADGELAAAMRRANHDYYTDNVAPAAHLRRVLGASPMARVGF